MFRYDIGDIPIEMTASDPCILDSFNSFLSSRIENPDLKIHLNNCTKINKPEGKILMNEWITWCQSPYDNEFFIYICEERPDEITYMLNVNNNWNNATITFLKNKLNSKYIITGAFGEIVFRNRILFHQGIVIHASAIELEGSGVLFSAPSETGKSTHANLWKIHRGAKIINGDRPAVRVKDGIPYVYGTPWSGSSNEFINTHVPLTAIVMLEQAPQNSIRRLDNHEAVLRLMPRCFLPYYDDKLMDIAIDNLEKIITSTPVYLLKCTPDKEAMELVYHSIF
ncbi:hypothetical protein CPJCM30710_13940 [Clostridium polyendosporum]|uniref:SynChlorMet cassette protein ScmC n=1 Tax=Clostridium polyendosporum TaxID=69208 RepID=A0A919VLL9_9CLOT|nr:hypothetical protein [Clostridium polyendosporum]GIM28728.1 hypothetical protein CPJCM30710_13940 [Clostridium polyendosporum]